MAGEYDDRLGEADLALLGRYREVEAPDGLPRPLPGFDILPGGRIRRERHDPTTSFGEGRRVDLV